MLSKNSPKVLVVDDEEFNMDIIKEHLTSSGFNVITAGDGDIALQKMELNPDVDVIVLDRMMPRMNGMEVIKILKEDARFKQIPVVMQTAAAQTTQVLEGIKAGVYYYLTKPYKGSVLISIVHAALEDGFKKKEIELEIQKNMNLPNLIEQCDFEFSTLAEAKSLAYFISRSFPDPKSAAFGLTELMTKKN